MTETVELKVLILTSPNTVDMVEAAVRRQLAPLFVQGAVYVERVTPHIATHR